MKKITTLICMMLMLLSACSLKENDAMQSTVGVENNTDGTQIREEASDEHVSEKESTGSESEKNSSIMCII